MQIKNIFDSTPVIGLKTYPPSVLVITNNLDLADRVHQTLESNGCQVNHIPVSCKSLHKVRREHFDLFVLDVASINPEVVELCETLKTDSDWSAIPKAILTPVDLSVDAILQLGIPISDYHFYSDVSFESSLLQVVKQIHYLSYRYL